MKRGNSGQVLVLVALAIFVLLGFAALGIDVGYMYSVRHELQRSADSGALAGASAFITGDWDDTSMAPDHPRGIADARAREFASKDTVVRTTLNPAEPPDGEVHVSFPQHDRIEVITSRNADLFFARIFGMANQLITARAVAQAAVVGSDLPVDCIKPWAIPYPWQDSPDYGLDHQGNPNGLYDGPGTYNGIVRIEGEQTYKTCDENVTPHIGLCAGNQLIVKIGTPNDNTSPSGQQSSGQFFIIQGNLGGENWFTGGADYREFIKSGCFKVDMNLPLDLMTGDKVGPTRQGVQDLINDDPNATWPDGATQPLNSRYADNNWTASLRVVRVAIYDPSKPMLGSNSGGTGTHTYIQANGDTPGSSYSLAGFWIEDLGAQGTVTGRYIPASAFGAVNPDPGPETGTELKIISLVE